MLLTRTRDCTGCTACLNICPKSAITFHADKEGFLHPKVDVEKCVGCGLCNKVCPIQNNTGRSVPQFMYALKNRNENIRINSSSGGVFFEMASFIIRNHGVVYGARFDRDWKVFHAGSETIDEVMLLMKSKYVQSNLGFIFKDILSKLRQGRKVLFVGTPCQVSGLNKYLNCKFDDNCYTVELCCHGVPSPFIWSKYIREEFLMPEIKSINFRSKRNGWRNYSLEIEDIKGNRFCQTKEKNAYLRGFLHGLYMRPKCFDCPNKPFRSNADIIIGDYWGVDIRHKYFNDAKGISLALAMTEKGKHLLDNIGSKFDKIEINWEDVVSVNGNFSASTPVSKIRRSKFWLYQKLGLTVRQSVELSLMPPIHRIVKNKISSICKR